MTQSNNQQEKWQQYVDRELERLIPTLTDLGYELDEDQPHLKGERYLMQAVTTEGGRKVIVLGHDQHGARVVIKASSDPAGIRELDHEERAREMLHRIRFAYGTFASPQLLASFTKDGQRVTIQRYITQQSTFLERPAAEQFHLALRAFKAQESAHATTERHVRQIRTVFENYDAPRYLTSCKHFSTAVMEHEVDQETRALFTDVLDILSKNQTDIERYTGFLTHTDFVPHNIRIHDDTIYLLDHSSLRFGNKHEGWARFMNFMTLYHPALEQALAEYVQNNRAPEEVRSLWLMRVYRLCEIIHYYVHKTELSTGDLESLNRARVVFWRDVLRAVLAKTELDPSIRAAYIETRDRLRSPDEKKRQIGLH
jgi:hypothetical protein